MLLKLLKLLVFYIAIFLFLTPFLIGYGLYLLLAPATFWQTCIWLFLSIIIGSIEGICAWILGIGFILAVFE